MAGIDVVAFWCFDDIKVLVDWGGEIFSICSSPPSSLLETSPGENDLFKMNEDAGHRKISF